MSVTTQRPWTFKTWISKFIEVDLPIGDLSKDIKADKNFPISEEYSILHTYLEEIGACPEALEAFEAAWTFYQATK